MSKQNPISNKIVVGYSKLKISLPLFIASKRGLFNKYGLEVEFKEYNNAKDIVDAIISQEIQLGGYCALPVVFEAMALNEEVKFNFIGGVFEDESHPISYLLRRKEIEIENENNYDLRQIEGHKIGYFPTNAYKIWLNYLLKINNITYESSDLIAIPVDEQEEKLKSGKIDYLLTNDPIASKIIVEEIGESVIDANNAIIPDILDRSPFYFGSFILNTAFTNENPKIAKRLSKALDDAIDFIKAHQKNKSGVISQCLSQYLTIDSVVAQKLKCPLFLKTNKTKQKSLNEIKKLYFDQAIILKKISVNSLQYVRKTPFSNLKNIYYSLEEAFEKRKMLFTGIGFLLTTIFSFIVSNQTAKKGIESQIEQFQNQLQLERKNLPAQFILRYQNTNLIKNQRAQLANIGYSTLLDVEADIDYYFISKSNEIYLASILYNTISDIHFEKLKEQADYRDKQQLKIDLNEYRQLSIKYKLEPAKERNKNRVDYTDSESAITFDNSSSIISNALRIGKALDFQVIARWHISYYEEVSKEKKRITKYILFTDKEIITDKFDSNAINLEDIVGGQGLIELIKTYEINSKSMIY